MAKDVDPECIFCRIAEGSVPSSQVYADDTVMAFRDRNPVAPVHILVVPRRHIRGINSPQAQDGLILSSLVRAANQIATEPTTGYPYGTLIGSKLPAFSFNETYFLAHALRVGGEFRF